MKLASAAIRNRLIDHHHRERRHTGTVSLDMPSSEEHDRSLGKQIPDQQDDMEAFHERAAAQKEIQEFSEQLQSFDLSF